MNLAQTYNDINYEFYGLQQVFSNTVHWVFAMKYWGVAKRFQLHKNNENPDKFNMTFQVIFWMGFVLNAAVGSLIGVPYGYVPWKGYAYFAISA